MTTDPFTEAAYSSAQEQYPGPTGSRRGGRSLALCQQRAHVEGWEAARTHLAAQDARVRRDAAREALDDLALDFDDWGREMHTDEVARRIRHGRNTHYPEEKR